MSVYTASELRRRHRRMDRRTAAKWRILGEIRAGACLYRRHVSGRIYWSLSTGTQVSIETAADVIADGHVVPVGDGLAPWGPSQIYRWSDVG